MKPKWSAMLPEDELIAHTCVSSADVLVTTLTWYW